MLPIINLGPLSFPAPQLIMLIGFWIGATLSERRARNASHDAESLSKVIWISTLSGILGARLSFLARHPAAFQDQWGSLLSLNQGLLDPVGGILIAITAGYLVANRNQLPGLTLLDDLVPLFSVLIPALHLANFASGTGYGAPSDLPWAIELWGGKRHPVQIYYFAASLAVLSIVLSRGSKGDQAPGRSSLLFIILTTGYWIFFNTFQDPVGNLIAGFRVTQIFSWLLFTGFFVLYNWQWKTRRLNATD